MIFPVNPESLEISSQAEHGSYKLMNVGEVVVPGPKGLQSFSFSAYFPRASQPDSYIKKIEGMMADKEIVRLIITRSDLQGKKLWDTNCQAVIDSFKYEEQGGEVGAVFFDIELIEYRPFTVRVIV